MRYYQNSSGLWPIRKLECRGKRPHAHASIPDPSLLDGLPVDDSTAPVSAQTGGTQEALTTLRRFIDYKLKGYSRNRNQPELDGTSRPLLLSSLWSYRSPYRCVGGSEIRRPAARSLGIPRGIDRSQGTGAQLCAFQLAL